MFSKGLAIAVILLFIGMSVVPSTAVQELKEKPSPISFDGNTLYVGGSGAGNYTKIQDAIDNATDGDTVFVYDDSSPYYEDLTIERSINLVGEDKHTTAIYGYEPIRINACNVTVCNFNLTGENHDIFIYGGQHYITIRDNILGGREGITLYEASNFVICNNTFLNDMFGIHLIYFFYQNKIINNSFYGNGFNIFLLDDNSSFYNNTISGNTINGKSLLYFENQSNKIIDGNAGQIILLGCDNITIRNQELSFSYMGLCIFYSENILIENNSIHSNWWGIIILKSGFKNNIRILNNTIQSCNSGCYIDKTPGCYIANNEFSFCSGELGGIGLFIKDSSFCNITNNFFKFNQVGFQLASSNCNISRNEFLKNYIIGISLAYCRDNQIKYNNFKRNGLPLFCDVNFYFEPGSNYQNLFDGNYWSRPRFFPKIIFGFTMFYYGWRYRLRIVLQIDWHPALTPYDIGV